MYYPYYASFNIFTLLANWLKLVCYNFPFAFFSQIFFIQPVVRWLFRKLFAKDIAKNVQAKQEQGKNNNYCIQGKDYRILTFSN